MEIKFKEFVISDDKEKIQFDRVCQMLTSTYWAKERPASTIKKSIENSVCFGVYLGDIQIGFARCITDYAVIYRLEDVVIDENYRGKGLGKALTKFITEHETLSPLMGLLGTEDAQGLYAQLGFKACGDIQMYINSPTEPKQS